MYYSFKVTCPTLQVNGHDNSTIIYFYRRKENQTEFVKVLLVKLSELLDSSNFITLFHCQSFALYGIQ